MAIKEHFKEERKGSYLLRVLCLTRSRFLTGQLASQRSNAFMAAASSLFAARSQESLLRFCLRKDCGPVRNLVHLSVGVTIYVFIAPSMWLFVAIGCKQGGKIHNVSLHARDTVIAGCLDISCYMMEEARWIEAFD